MLHQGKAAEDSRTPKRWRAIPGRYSFREVLECGLFLVFEVWSLELSERSLTNSQPQASSSQHCRNIGIVKRSSYAR